MKSRLKLPCKKILTHWRNACETLFFELLKTFLGEASEAKMRQTSLASNTIQRRISDMLEDVKD